MEEERMYVLIMEKVGGGMGPLYGAFAVNMTFDGCHGHHATTRTVVEPQREISDLAKLLKYGYRNEVKSIPRRSPSRFSFDRPSEIPEFTAELQVAAPHEYVRYTSLSEGERRNFMREMSGFLPHLDPTG